MRARDSVGRVRRGSRSHLLPALALVLFLAPGAVLAADQENCMLCHRYAGLGMVDKEGAEHVFYVNEEIHRSSVHGQIACTSCHPDIRQIPHKEIQLVDCSNECHVVDPSSEKVFTHRRVIEEYAASVHGRKKPGLETDYPTCIDCHQDTMYATDSGEMTGKAESSRNEILQRCRACHEDERWVNRFFSHFFLRTRQHKSSKQIVALCSECHEDAAMMARHGLESTWSLKDTFHWEAIKYDSPNAPNCITCHAPPLGRYSVHNMKPLTDRESPFSDQEKRMQICSFQGCHPAATVEFAAGKVHSAGAKLEILRDQPPASGSAPLASQEEKRQRQKKQEQEHLKARVMAIIKLVYQMMIGSIVGFMFIHQILDYLAGLRERRRKRRHAAHAHEPGKDAVFVTRLTRNEVWQHNILMVCFIVLVVTGFMALISSRSIDAWFGTWAKTFYAARGFTHRFFAVILIIVSIWHFVYLGATKAGRRLFRDMLPRPKDGQDLARFFGWALGLCRKPEFERFDYREKLEYITGGIGTMIITATGIFLSFSSYFPLYVADISALIHLLEATLATLAIIVWHMYAVHLKPDKFPMGTAWIDGKLAAHEMEDEHPLYYRTVIEPKLAAGGEDPEGLVEYAHGPRKLDAFSRGWAMKVVMICFFALLAVSAVLLIKMLYFRRIEATPGLETRAQVSAAGKISYSVVRRGKQFHPMFLGRQESRRAPTACTPCHGAYPHAKLKDVRSLLNMHVGFMACEVCHKRGEDLSPEIRRSLRFDWYDDESGKVVVRSESRSGEYGALIVPSAEQGGTRRRLDQTISPEESVRLKERWAATPEADRQKARDDGHQGLSKKSITCQDCHRRESGYLDFGALGYPKNWIEELTGAEVAGMLNQYGTFYMPTMFNPDAIRRQREEMMRSRENGGKK